ncbi:MAG TPA: hypothetical protein VK629_13135 [Steroidobacteraceae bacterium]|nr:hypothetical protein [Steroidobacteraceae bacterium]
MKADRFWWSNFSGATPWAAVAVVLLITAYVNETIALDSLSFDSQPLYEQSMSEQGVSLVAAATYLRARTGWGVPAIGFALVAIAAVLTALFVIAQSFKDLAIRDRIRGSITIILAAAALLAAAIYAGESVISEPAVTSELRKATMHRTTATHAVAMSTMFDTISYLVFLLLLAAASASLVWSKTSAPTPASLALRLRQTRWLLYAGAAALVLRAIEMHALYRWPSVWLSKEMGAAVDQMALSLSTAHGAFYSAVLMALYLPTALTLRMRSKSLAIAAVGGGEQQEAWLAKEGLSLSPFKEMTSLMITLAPLLAGGPVSKLFGALAG